MMASNPGPDMTKAPHKEVLQVVRENSSPFVTTRDVSEQFAASKRTVIERLSDLVERGDLDGREVGANVKIWWDPDQLSAEPDPASANS
jgi:DNA-binding Lrp family transcriptional regulator